MEIFYYFTMVNWKISNNSTRNQSWWEQDMIEMRVVLSADMTDMMIIFNKMMLENTFSMGETYGEKIFFSKIDFSSNILNCMFIK